MATCKDCIHDKLCVIKAFPDAFENTEWSKKPCDHFKPTADFVPKSEAHDDHHKQVACYTLGCREGDKIKREVARKIFEEIEEFILTCIENDEKVFNNGEDEYYDGRFMGFKIIEEHLVELKKKYTEDQNNEN